MARYGSEDLKKSLQENATCIDNHWTPARPINYKLDSWFQRCKYAWLVFTGRADVIQWHKQ